MYSRYSGHQPFIPMNNRMKYEDRHNERRQEPHEDRREDRHMRHVDRHDERRAERSAPTRWENGIFGLKPGFLSGFLKNLDFDSDDILLILIILFMSKESDDIELLIILGLMLFMGL